MSPRENRPGLFARLGRVVKDLVTGHPLRAAREVTQPEARRQPAQEREPERPREQPQPQPAGGFFGPGGDESLLPLSDREYHVIISGRGSVWYTPFIGPDEADAKDYIINMQGYVRGGNKHHSRRYYEGQLAELRNTVISGRLSTGENIFGEELETDLDNIDYYANTENMTGDGWRSP